MSKIYFNPNNEHLLNPNNGLYRVVAMPSKGASGIFTRDVELAGNPEDLIESKFLDMLKPRGIFPSGEIPEIPKKGAYFGLNDLYVLGMREFDKRNEAKDSSLSIQINGGQVMLTYEPSVHHTLGMLGGETHELLYSIYLLKRVQLHVRNPDNFN